MCIACVAGLWRLWEKVNFSLRQSVGRRRETWSRRLLLSVTCLPKQLLALCQWYISTGLGVKYCHGFTPFSAQLSCLVVGVLLEFLFFLFLNLISKTSTAFTFPVSWFFPCFFYSIFPPSPSPTSELLFICQCWR